MGLVFTGIWVNLYFPLARAREAVVIFSMRSLRLGHICAKPGDFLRVRALLDLDFYICSCWFMCKQRGWLSFQVAV